MKVVIDTNALLVTIRKSSIHRPIWDALRAEKFELAVTTDILLEYSEILTQQINAPIAERVMTLIEQLPTLKRTQIFFKWNLIKADPDDNKFVDAAISARVRYVVTNDKHFNILKEINFPRVDIISLDEFLIEIQNM